MIEVTNENNFAVLIVSKSDDPTVSLTVKCQFADKIPNIEQKTVIPCSIEESQGWKDVAWGDNDNAVKHLEIGQPVLMSDFISKYSYLEEFEVLIALDGEGIVTEGGGSGA